MTYDSRNLVAKMVSDAEERLCDARILSTSLSVKSNSAYLLKILAFEVLLKAAHVVSNGNYPENHDYINIWQGIDAAGRSKILEVARQTDHHAKLNDISQLMSNFKRLFQDARYWWSCNKKMKVNKIYSIVKKEEPGFYKDTIIVYCSIELHCLTSGLLVHLKDWLNSQNT